MPEPQLLPRNSAAVGCAVAMFDLVVEEMDSKQARLFSLLDLGKFMEK
jgi:hypothetical protein